MAYQLSRPSGAFGPSSGLLRVEHFQMAYVTTDIALACELLGAQLGIREFRELGGPLPDGGEIQARFAWVGTLMYELIEAKGPGSDIYSSRLPATGFHMRHHHLGYLVKDAAEIDAVVAQAGQHGWSVPSRGSNPLVDVCFVEVPALGHYLEYLAPTPLGLDFFDTVPRH